MRKLKLASFLNIIMPLVIISLCYLITEYITFNWALLLMVLFVLVVSMPLFGFIALVLDSIVIKKEGFGFVSFNLLVLSLIEFSFGMFVLFQSFFAG